MDDLYGNLDNYNEENRISELQAENKDLKSKLEDYAASVNKLQKDFDMLSSEYKKLETNYSSLMKTAKAEIERKTQIINNLNKEKDMMVLMCHQNKNIRPGQTRNQSKSMVSNNKVDVNIIPEKDTQPRKSESSRKESPCPSAERKEQDSLPTSSNPRSKLINLTNSSNQRDPRSEKNIEPKENIQDRKVKDTSKTSASIRNRRKSMSALSIEKDKFSSDTDEPSEAIAKDQNFHHRQKHKDFNHHDRPKSRISETCSLEERKQNHSYETEYYNHRQRSSRYEEEPTDRYRARHKSSNRYNRHSPDRYPDGPKDYYYRSHPDTHGSRRRDPESRMAHHSQDRYTTKRRTEHAYDGADSKRARLEPQYQHHELNQRMEDDRNLTNDRYLTDSPNIQFSSCESPDYDNLEFSQQQIKEIKLTASTKLADPRVTSHKYIVEKDKGKPLLHTVAGQDVDIVPLNRIAWGINPVSIPEALVKMPTIETDQSVKDICKEIENRRDTSMESGEITDRDVVPSYENLSTKRKINNESERKLPAVPVTKVEDIENMKESLQKINNYKNPKLKNPIDSQYNKDLSSKRHVGDDVNIKADANKQMLCVADVNKSNEVNDIEQEKSNDYIKDSQLPFSHHSEDRIPSAQEVVEGDLEMSDDNCDEKQSHEVVRETSISVKIPRSVVDNLKPCHTHKEEKNTVVLEPVILEEPCHKKSKTKKKSKHKETKSSKNENSEKPAKTTETKSNHIKSKFTELFDDSCSLINPEDLGVESIETKSLMPASCVPFFEDAVNEMPTPIKQNIPISAKPKVVIGNNQHCDPVLALYDPDVHEADDKAHTQTNSITEDDIESIYKNLEPGLPVLENVQTVVISTGVQPVLAGEEELVVSRKSNQIFGVIAQDIALEALATSTPHKPWQPDALPADTDVKLSGAGCSSSSNGSQKGTVNNPIKDRSDNTMDSQTSEVNEPDVRIFAKKRRRKVAAKK